MREGAAVGESDELGEGVGALWTAQKRRVTALGADEGCGFRLGGWQLAGQDRGCCAR